MVIELKTLLLPLLALAGGLLAGRIIQAKQKPLPIEKGMRKVTQDRFNGYVMLGALAMILVAGIIKESIVNVALELLGVAVAGVGWKHREFNKSNEKEHPANGK